MPNSVCRKIISVVLSTALFLGGTPLSGAEGVDTAGSQLLQQLTLFTMLDPADQTSSFAKIATAWFQKGGEKVLNAAALTEAEKFMDDIRRGYYEESPGDGKLKLAGDARYGEVMLNNGRYSLRAYNPSIVALEGKYAGHRRLWRLEYNPYLAVELIDDTPPRESALTDIQKKIVSGIRELAARGVKARLASTDLAGLEDHEIINYVRAFCVVRDEADAERLISERLEGRLAEVFEAVFDPRTGLRKYVDSTGKPINVVHVRGGRGAADITREWSDLAAEGLVKLSIIPGAVDDGRSWADMAFYMGATGVPDMGKSYANMGADTKAVRFSDIRLVEEDGQGSITYPMRVLAGVIRAAESGAYDSGDRNIQRILSGLDALEDGKRKFALRTMRVFLDRMKLEYSRKKHRIDMHNIPMRSLMIMGAEEACGSWQKAIDEFGEFVGARGGVYLPTEERLYAMAILEDGTILPTENAINEAAKEAEYIFFSVGPRPAVDKWVLLTLFLGILQREPTEQDLMEIEHLRVREYKDLRGIFVKFLHDKSPEDKMKAVKFIDRHFSYQGSSPAIEVQDAAISAITIADIIAYGPTDIESNIASAVMYEEIRHAIWTNGSAAKFFIANARDEHGVEPLGTTVSTELERLYRYLTDQQRYLRPEYDLESWPMSGVIGYVLGRDERFRGVGIRNYILFDEGRIASLGAVPVGLDFEMHSLRIDGGAAGQEGRTSKYSGALAIDAELSAFLLAKAGCPLEKLKEKLGPGPQASPGKTMREKREEKIGDIREQILPQLINTMSVCGNRAPAGEEPRKIGVFLDSSMGDGRLRGIQDALAALARSDDPVLKKMFGEIVIHTADVTASELEYLEEHKGINRENMVIITDFKEYECLKGYEEKSVITQVDASSLAGDGYYPFLEIVTFALMRLPELGYKKEDIVSFYNGIPNIQKLGAHEILALCWDGAKKKPRNMVVLKLMIPGADALTADSGMYQEIEDYIRSNA